MAKFSEDLEYRFVTIKFIDYYNRRFWSLSPDKKNYK